MLYGGICYLQYGDFVWVCEFIDVCCFFFKILLYLVDLLLIIIFIYNVGILCWMLVVGVFVYDVVVLDCNWGVQVSEKYILGGKVLFKVDVVEVFFEIDQ